LSVKGLSENNMIVTSKEISLILGVSDSRIRQLTTEKALVRVSHGKYDLSASVESYINYRLNKEKTGDDLDKTTEEALWTRARRKKTELELQIMRGELHRSDDVKRVMNDMLGTFRAKILSIPSKFAPQLVGKTEIPPIKDVLKKSVHEALEELSNYDPTVFYDISKDKMLLEDDEGVGLSEENELSDQDTVKRGRKKKG
jgi:phage terminase Nu1 subunit (DNA packaging protein)